MDLGENHLIICLRLVLSDQTSGLGARAPGARSLARSGASALSIVAAEIEQSGHPYLSGDLEPTQALE